jgi:hypothetical protein
MRLCKCRHSYACHSGGRSGRRRGRRRPRHATDSSRDTATPRRACHRRRTQRGRRSLPTRCSRRSAAAAAQNRVSRRRSSAHASRRRPYVLVPGHHPRLRPRPPQTSTATPPSPSVPATPARSGAASRQIRARVSRDLRQRPSDRRRRRSCAGHFVACPIGCWCLSARVRRRPADCEPG